MAPETIDNTAANLPTIETEGDTMPAVYKSIIQLHDLTNVQLHFFPIIPKCENK